MRFCLRYCRTMPTFSDLTDIPSSGLNHIDALIDQGPDWNFITPYTNTLDYTFSVTSELQDNRPGAVAFSATQQANARAALAYITSLTGIVFAETSNGAAAQLHFANIDITETTSTT